MENNNQDEEKVVVKLKKEYLQRERLENRRKAIYIIIMMVLFVITLFSVITLIDVSKSRYRINNEFDNKISEIKGYLNDKWVYGNDYDDLDSEINNKIFYGMTDFEEDPYTTYMNPDDMNYFSNSINKVQLGIGVSYYKEYNGYPYVLQVYKDSGADKGGIKKGDRIISIDGSSTYNITDDEIKGLVLGDEGTFVKIEVLRNNEKIVFDCERKYFDSTAYAKLYNDVVVLTVSSVGSDVAKVASNELKEFTNYHKLIIDLRDNSGGYQTALLELSALFLENNTLVMNEIDKDNNKTSYYADYTDHYYNFDHIVIITNENTASASEVFALCMREQHPDTTIVGKETYGKGVVQTTYSLNDGSYFKVTTSYWTSPNGVPLLENGVFPDIELSLDDVFYTTRYVFDEGSSYKYDSVSSYVIFCEKALKYLGYPVNRTDGYFDKSFENALNMFKNDNNISQNGVLDKETYEKIYDKLMIDDRDEQLEAALEIINK